MWSLLSGSTKDSIWKFQKLEASLDNKKYCYVQHEQETCGSYSIIQWHVLSQVQCSCSEVIHIQGQWGENAAPYSMEKCKHSTSS